MDMGSSIIIKDPGKVHQMRGEYFGSAGVENKFKVVMGLEKVDFECL